MDIKVYGNDIEKALKALKRQLQRESLFKDLKKKRFHEKPSVKKKQKQIEAKKKRIKSLIERRKQWNRQKHVIR